MSKAKQREQRNIIIAVAVSAIIILALFMYTGYNPIANKTSGKGDFLTITVVYANGVTDTYTKANSTQGVSLSILYNGIAVTEFYSNLWITPTYTLGVNSAGVTDSINSWSLTGTFGEYLTTSSSSSILQNAGTVPLYPLWTSQGSANLPGGVPEAQPTLVSGQAVEVASCSVNAQQLQSLYSGWVQGQVYNVYNSFSGSATINFAQAGALTQTVENSNGASTITGMFQVEYISASTFSITGAFAYS